MPAQGRQSDLNLQHALQGCEYETICERIATDRPEHILDWGCGFGHMSARLKERGLNVTSFDYRPEGVAQAGVARLDRYPDIEAYLEPHEQVTLPYEDDTFDAVLSLGVLEHVSDPEASLDELHRTLKPGGTLYVYKLPNRFSYLEVIARLAGLYYHGSYPNDRVYDLAGAAQLVGRHGFAVRELRLANMLPLMVGGEQAAGRVQAVWRLNQALAGVPGLRGLATNIELVATA